MWSSFQDCHVTVLGFTDARGQPVCCVIILASMEITAKHIMGLQPWAEISGDPMVDFKETATELTSSTHMDQPTFLTGRS
jgi:hypothetical protein